jgi:nicotinate-nucleotide pyrophosphorylase (carboxylating)
MLQVSNNKKEETVYDLRDQLFLSIQEKLFKAEVVANNCGILANTKRAVLFVNELGCELLSCLEDGTAVQPGDVILSFRGTPKSVAMAEDRVLGSMMVPSGYATRARQLQLLAGNDLKVVCGGWKKLPQELKPGLHAALTAGRIGMRMVEGPFVYIDKNYVRMFGGVRKALEAGTQFTDHKTVIQIRGEYQSIAEETHEAVLGQASVLMVDTGSLKDLKEVLQILDQLNVRPNFKVAFAGNVTEETLLLLRHMPVDLVDVGASILNAPLLDMRVDVKRFDYIQ